MTTKLKVSIILQIQLVKVPRLIFILLKIDHFKILIINRIFNKIFNVKIKVTRKNMKIQKKAHQIYNKHIYHLQIIKVIIIIVELLKKIIKIKCI